MQILSGLVYNPDYTTRVMPYIDHEYFNRRVDCKVIFTLIREHMIKYGSPPTKESLEVDLNNLKLIERVHTDASKVLYNLSDKEVNPQWLFDQTEEFCKKKAFENAIDKAMEITSNKESTTKEYGTVYDLVKKALEVSLTASDTHDYMRDFMQRYDYYTRPTTKTPVDLEMFNRVTNGGFIDRSMVCFIAPTGKGKSLFLCHFAASLISSGKNVYYVTLEMPAEQIGQRIDANLMNINMDEFADLERDDFENRIDKLKTKVNGTLKVDHFVAHSVHVGHLRHRLNELKMKEGFKPDVIMVDYLGIMSSMRAGKNANSHDYLKIVTEELRGLGQEFECITFTAAQVNRNGAEGVEFNITDIAESWGIPQTVDYMYGIISSVENEKINKIIIKRLKDRHNDESFYNTFEIGINRRIMQLHNLDNLPPDVDATTYHEAKNTTYQPPTKKSRFDMNNFMVG